MYCPGISRYIVTRGNAIPSPCVSTYGTVGGMLTLNIVPTHPLSVTELRIVVPSASVIESVFPLRRRC